MCKKLVEEIQVRIDGIMNMKRPKWEDDKVRLATLVEIRTLAIQAEKERPKVRRKKRTVKKAAARKGGARRTRHAQVSA